MIICIDIFSILFSGIRIHNETVPSGVYSALNNAKLTDSVLMSFNDVNLRWIAREKWTYSLEFNGRKLSHALLKIYAFIINTLYYSFIAASENYKKFSTKYLTFHGIDTIATIELNGVKLSPNPNNMFIRYRYNVKDILVQVIV